MRCKFKYIHMVRAKKQNTKTWIYNVLTNNKIIESGVTPHEILLGVIKYYAQWRQYEFYPEQETVFEKTCLEDIKQFCIHLNERQKIRSKK